MKITTDNKPRPLVSWHDIPSKAQPDFEYIDNDDRFTDRFVKYKGEWYDVNDTQRISTAVERGNMGWDMHVEPDSPLAKWHAILSDSYFSGVLFRFVDENGVIVGRYYT